MPTLTLHAPAKLNLWLHLQGRRADGYHLLESLVVFTDLADVLTLEPADNLSFSMEGPFAVEAGAGEGNLVMRAARALQRASGTGQGARLTLSKYIPVGAGLGGGSSDAAATLTGLNRLWQLGLSDAALHKIAVSLGADVAMCLKPRSAIVRGIGEVIESLSCPPPPMPLLLVYPRTALLTKEVYAQVDGSKQTPHRSAPLPAGNGMAEWISYLAAQRNHLQTAAIQVTPLVAEVLLALETLQPTPLLSRMTGSGACCFAVYETMEEATRAAKNLAQDYPDWWIHSCASS